jgi:hypothetical protein
VKIIMLALVLTIGISGTLATALEVQGSSSSSTVHVYEINPMTEEELALAEATCPFSEENLGSYQPSIQANLLPSGSLVVDSYHATDVPQEVIVVWQRIGPMTEKELAIADATCPFNEENLFARTIASPDKSQIALSHKEQNSLSVCSLETGLNKAAVMNAYKSAHRADFTL